MEIIMAKNTTRKKKNRNMVIIKDVGELVNEVDYNQFIYQNHFSLLCRLIPNKKRERLEIEVVNEESFKESSFVYIFVIEGKIFKIGQSITNIKKRVSSYNCGKTEYRIGGTNSTTNYFILQSILEMDCPVEVFALFANKMEYDFLDEHGKDSFPSTKIMEKKIIGDFMEKYGKKPIANTQR